jgi:methionyl-tRNA synthetase
MRLLNHVEQAFCWPGRSPAAQSWRKGFVHCDHEYLNFKGSKLSKSRGALVGVRYFLSKYDPDLLRFHLTAAAPETRRGQDQAGRP